MTNEEIILNGTTFNDTIYDFELLFDDFYNRDARTMSALEDYAKYFKEENNKLKDEITTLSKANESLVKRDTNNNFKIKDLESDIENYKSYLTTWNNANNELLKYNDELKAEIEQLKSTISEMETTTAQEDDLK